MLIKKKGDTMKKILKINAIVILLFSSLLTYFTFKNNDTYYWDNWGYSETCKEIYMNNTGYSGEDLYNLLTTLAKEEKVNLVKTDYLEDKDNTKIVKSIYIADKSDDLFIDNKINHEYDFEKNQEDSAYFLATKKTTDNNQIGEVFDPFDDDYVEFWPLEKFQNERGNLDGTYIVRALEQGNIQSFVEKLSERSGIPLEELIKQTTFIGTMQSPIESISLAATIIALILFGILSVYYAVNNIKKIGVMKLNGYSNNHIWQSLIVSIINTIILASLILDLIMQSLLKNLTRDFMLTMIATQVLLVGVLMIISSVIYFIIRRNTISNLIKEKRPILLITSITYIVKNVLLLVIVSLIVFMTAGFQDIEAEYARLDQWNKVGDLAVLVNVNIGNDQASFSQGKADLQEDFVKYYQELNKNGAIYVSVDEFTPHAMFKTKLNEANNSYEYVDYFDPTVVPFDYSTTEFLVNPNYLEEYPLHDINGDIIKISESDERTILIPDTKASMADSLKSIYTSKYKDTILSSNRFFGLTNDNLDDIKINTIIYKSDKNGYFTFNTDYEETNYKVNEPIFEVAPDHEMTLIEKGNIRMQGLQSPLKLKLGNMTSNEYNQQLNTLTAKFNLDDNDLRYMTIKEVFGNEIENLKQACQQYLIAMGICFIVMILITIQMTQMILETEKKKYCILKLNGFKFIDRFKKILFLNSIVEIIVSALALLIAPSLMNIQLNYISFMIIIPLLVINVFLVCCLLRYFENKNISQMVKGE